MHQHYIYRQPMQPGRKSRLASKSCDLAIQLEKRFLRKILSCGGITRHPQTERVNPPLVPVVKRLERFRVPLLGPLDRLGFVKLGARSLSWLGQVAFSGRTLSDAA